MERVVSNASPLIALEQIGKLWLLQALFQRIIIPPAVAREISPTVTTPSWIDEQATTQPVGPRILSTSLGAGEREALALALELDSRWLILDERPARRLAQALGLPVIGTLGILLSAKKKRLIGAISPSLDGLMLHDFRLSTALCKQVLREAGE